MPVQFLLPTGAALFSVVVFATVFIMAVRRRQTPGAWQLAVLMVMLGGVSTCCWWLLLSAPGAGHKHLFAAMWIFLTWVGLCLLGAVRPALGMRSRLGRVWWLVLSIPALAVDVVLLLRPALFAAPVFSQQDGFTAWLVHPGPFYFIGLSYVVALLLGSVAILARPDARRGRRDGAVRVSLLVGFVTTTACGLLTAASANNLIHAVPRYVAPMVFLLSFGALALSFAVAVFRFRMLSLSPLADTLLNTLGDPICVLDEDGRLLLVNDSFSGLAGRPGSELLGLNLREALPCCATELLATTEESLESSDLEVSCAADVPRAYLVSRQRHRGWGGVESLILVMRDITARKQAEAERDAQLTALNEALAEVRQLRDFLPICAYCKKVRDDKDYWRQIDDYITERTGVLFSHGVCPDCTRHLRADLEVLEPPPD